MEFSILKPDKKYFATIGNYNLTFYWLSITIILAFNMSNSTHHRLKSLHILEGLETPLENTP